MIFSRVANVGWNCWIGCRFDNFAVICGGDSEFLLAPKMSGFSFFRNKVWVIGCPVGGEADGAGGGHLN